VGCVGRLGVDHNCIYCIKTSHLRSQAVMSKDSRVGHEIRVRGYARSLSPAHSQKITRSHNILNSIKREDSGRIPNALIMGCVYAYKKKTTHTNYI